MPGFRAGGVLCRDSLCCMAVRLFNSIIQPDLLTVYIKNPFAVAAGPIGNVTVICTGGGVRLGRHEVMGWRNDHVIKWDAALAVREPGTADFALPILHISAVFAGLRFGFYVYGNAVRQFGGGYRIQRGDIAAGINDDTASVAGIIKRVSFCSASWGSLRVPDKIMPGGNYPFVFLNRLIILIKERSADAAAVILSAPVLGAGARDCRVFSQRVSWRNSDVLQQRLSLCVRKFLITDRAGVISYIAALIAGRINGRMKALRINGMRAVTDQNSRIRDRLAAIVGRVLLPAIRAEPVLTVSGLYAADCLICCNILQFALMYGLRENDFCRCCTLFSLRIKKQLSAFCALIMLHICFRTCRLRIHFYKRMLAFGTGPCREHGNAENQTEEY